MVEDEDQRLKTTNKVLSSSTTCIRTFCLLSFRFLSKNVNV